ncbi:MAG: hypothetical protein ACFCU3_09575 [Verrucomicrobiales bacterium]
MRLPILSLLVAAVGLSSLSAQSPYQSSSDFARYAKQLRENALERLEPTVDIPTTNRRQQVQERSSSERGSASTPRFRSRYPWRTNIVTTVFWIGESAAPPRNPVANKKSSWDQNWQANFGGYDDPNPANRRNYIPKAFVPRQNPFYIALPYNDTTRGRTKPEARRVIPWFARDFEREGKSVCKGRWIAIRKGDRIAYAQWEDCGPFRTDHYQYVFGNERPSSNINKGAGLDVSPAVRDYLGLTGMDVTDWRFVEENEVPQGPWRLYGDNNPFAQKRRGERELTAR